MTPALQRPGTHPRAPPTPLCKPSALTQVPRTPQTPKGPSCHGHAGPMSRFLKPSPPGSTRAASCGPHAGFRRASKASAHTLRKHREPACWLREPACELGPSFGFKSHPYNFGNGYIHLRRRAQPQQLQPSSYRTTNALLFGAVITRAWESLAVHAQCSSSLLWNMTLWHQDVPLAARTVAC